MTPSETTPVEVTLNAQQLELLTTLCAEHGFATPAEALRHGLREYLGAGSQEGGR